MSAAGSKDINVTPLIDVLLVLLIIFLVMMPIMVRFVPVALPAVNPGVHSTAISVTLKLEADLSIALDDGPQFPGRELAARLRPKLANADAVFVNSADTVLWTHLVSTVDTVRGVAADVQRRNIEVAVQMRTVE
jgi:biopolymer transport protein ExbD